MMKSVIGSLNKVSDVAFCRAHGVGTGTFKKTCTDAQSPPRINELMLAGPSKFLVPSSCLGLLYSMNRGRADAGGIIICRCRSM